MDDLRLLKVLREVALRGSFSAAAEAQAELSEIASSARGRLRIASFATAAGTIVPLAFSGFRRLRPGVQVELQLLDPPQSIPALRRGDVDLAITEEGGFEADPE